MKKITFILFALIAGTTFAQNKISKTDTKADAVIISPLSLTETSSLNFGRILNSTAGKVTVTPAGARSFEFTNMNTPSAGNNPSAAGYKIASEKDYSYNLTITGPGTIAHSSGTETMSLTLNATLDGSAITLTESSITNTTTADKILKIGGVLAVAAGQAVGDYSGDIKVEVAYN
jgi:hypothetical protein